MVLPSPGSSFSSAGPWVAGRQVHDANIVATMLAHGETRLLTSNRSDFKRFAHAIEVVEP
jgi:predicted nucleic acid-binding protein